MERDKVIVIGGGVAGVEAAFQAARLGSRVELYEMRPETQTEAHTSAFLGELVCSNSLGATQVSTPSGLLKEELQLLGSFYLKIAEQFRVPAGSSFSVDRLKLAERITQEIENSANITLIRQEVKEIPATDAPVIIASGPLTSSAFAQELSKLTMRKNLFFYDATSPIIAADSIDFEKVYMASRYDKGEADFVNIPLNEEQYKEFVKDLVQAEKVEIKDFEKGLFFEACLPIEEIAARGEQSLAFGPLRPVGLEDPRTGVRPHAVIQLRQDDLQKNFFQMVGFQTRLKWGEQKRIFKKLPGLKNAEFERYGRMHRNTYINGPLIVNKFYQSKLKSNIFFAGQICGVEGYVESINSGLIAGIYAAQRGLKKTQYTLPETTASGALIHYISQANWRDFRPTKFSFGLLPEIQAKRMSKKQKKEMKANIALEEMRKWLEKAGI